MFKVMQAGFKIRKAWLSPVSKLAGLLEMMFKATHGGMGKVAPPSLNECIAMLPSASACPSPCCR